MNSDKLPKAIYRHSLRLEALFCFWPFFLHWFVFITDILLTLDVIFLVLALQAIVNLLCHLFFLYFICHFEVFKWSDERNPARKDRMKVKH